MVLLGVLVVVFIVVAAMLASRRREVTPGRPHAIRPAQVEACVSSGIISREQADALYAAQPTRQASGVPVAVEAVGYVGGLLALIAGGIIMSELWDQLATWARLSLLAAGALVMLGAGIAVGEHRGPAGTRLEAFLWLLSAAATAGFAGLLAVDVFGLDGSAVVVVTASTLVVHSGALWRLGDRPAQQAVAGVSLAVAAGALTALLGGGPGAVGLTVYAVGAASIALGLAKVVRVAEVQEALGVAGVLVGSAITAGQWEAVAPLLGLATAVALGALGMRRQELVLNGGGLIGLVVFLIWTLTYFFHGTVGLPLVFLVAGLALLVAAVVLFRRRGGPVPPAVMT